MHCVREKNELITITVRIRVAARRVRILIAVNVALLLVRPLLVALLPTTNRLTLHERHLACDRILVRLRDVIVDVRAFFLLDDRVDLHLQAGKRKGEERIFSVVQWAGKETRRNGNAPSCPSEHRYRQTNRS